jgi:hypothetical protein
MAVTARVNASMPVGLFHSMFHNEPTSITVLPLRNGLCHKQIWIFYIAHANGMNYNIAESNPSVLN